MALLEDSILEDRYRIDKLLARGGMGAIYRAFDNNLNMPVAIKENFFSTPQSIKQFQQEALILARLRHPSLPRVIHHFGANDKHYLVMDFIEGEDLWEIVKSRGKPLPEEQALRYIIQVCKAVAYLHQQDPPIIHRDIKPQNIKITPQDEAVLVDFGIAKVFEDDKGRTRTGAQAVTPGFSPPEQYSGTGTTPKSDIYSLGATLYAILTGKKPPNSISLLTKKEFTTPAKINRNLSDKVSQAIIRAMNPDADERPPTVEDWRYELRQALKAHQMGTKRTDTDEEETWTPGQVIAPAATATHWLVDSKEQGYPLGESPLVIGRQSQVDVPVPVKSASRQHAYVRVVGGQCEVMDNNSANGTFINKKLLTAGKWVPANPGDQIEIGSARFGLTKEKPKKVIPVVPKPLFSQDDDAVTTSRMKSGSTEQTSQASSDVFDTPAPSSPRKSSLPIFPIIVGVILILVIIGAGVYLIVNASEGKPPSSSIQLEATEEVESESNASAVDTEEPEESEAESTPMVAEEDSPASLEKSAIAPLGDAGAAQEFESDQEAVVLSKSAEEEPTPTSTPTEEPTPTPTQEPEPTATDKPAPTATQKVATATTASKRVVAPTSTTTPTPTVAETKGPTAIPIEYEDTIPEIGNREVIDVDINPNHPDEVYALVKGDGIYRSVEGGEGPWGKLPINASGATSIVIDPTNSKRLFAPSWNAVLRSDDGGNSWRAFGNGLSTANRTVDLVTVNPFDPKILYGGIGGTLVVSTDRGENWKSDDYGRGLAQGKLTSIVVDPFNGDVIFVGGEFGSLYKSTDGGRNFIQLAFSTGEGTYSIAAHPSKRDIYLAGINSYNAGIIKTENGADFTSSSRGLIYGGADSAYSAITYAPSNPTIVYTGSGYESDRVAKGIFKSTDGGTSWSSINSGLSKNPTTGYPHYVKSMVVHPTNSDIVWAATGGGLYQTINGGSSWSLK